MSFKSACLMSCGAWMMMAVVFLIFQKWFDTVFFATGAFVLWQIQKAFDL